MPLPIHLAHDWSSVSAAAPRRQAELPTPGRQESGDGSLRDGKPKEITRCASTQHHPDMETRRFPSGHREIIKPVYRRAGGIHQVSGQPDRRFVVGAPRRLRITGQIIVDTYEFSLDAPIGWRI